MDYKNIITSLQTDKKYSDILGLHYFSKEDSTICDYLIPKIPYLYSTTHHQETISLDSLFDESLKDIKPFISIECHEKLSSIISYTPIQLYDGTVSFVNITFKRDFMTGGISKLGTIRSYTLPRSITKDNIITLIHEHCHALKDTNYKEHADTFVTGEVIPMFFELINYENDELRKITLQNRLHGLANSKDLYLYAKENKETINKNVEPISLYIPNHSLCDFVKSYSGVYLNSFYYALILYHLYKENSTKILKLISNVLTQEITTIEMLKLLNIHNDIKGEIFEQEINSLKKVLKL